MTYETESVATKTKINVCGEFAIKEKNYWRASLRELFYKQTSKRQEAP